MSAYEKARDEMLAMAQNCVDTVEQINAEVRRVMQTIEPPKGIDMLIKDADDAIAAFRRGES